MAKVTAECRICILFLSSAIATLLSSRLQGLHSRLGYARRVYSKGLPLNENVDYEDELNTSILDRVALAGKKFDWMLVGTVNRVISVNVNTGMKIQLKKS